MWVNRVDEAVKFVYQHETAQILTRMMQCEMLETFYVWNLSQFEVHSSEKLFLRRWYGNHWGQNEEISEENEETLAVEKKNDFVV